MSCTIRAIKLTQKGVLQGNAGQALLHLILADTEANHECNEHQESSAYERGACTER